jgi:hypothetical protein
MMDRLEMPNRGAPDGIWGHDLEDLGLNYLYKARDSKWYMSIDS